MIVFSLTQGRTGTMFLTELFKANMPHIPAHHERLDPRLYGIHTPDTRELRLYNTFGPDWVADFWARKADAVAGEMQGGGYVETAHMLFKAGLVDHLSLFPERPFLVHLYRAPEKVIASMAGRGAYRSFGAHWLWHLDYGYPRNRLDAQPFLDKFGYYGLLAWYWAEVEARIVDVARSHRVIRTSVGELSTPQGAAAFFEALGAPVGDPTIPPKANAGAQEALPDGHRAIIDKAAAFAVERAASA